MSDTRSTHNTTEGPDLRPQFSLADVTTAWPVADPHDERHINNIISALPKRLRDREIKTTDDGFQITLRTYNQITEEQLLQLENRVKLKTGLPVEICWEKIEKKPETSKEQETLSAISRQHIGSLIDSTLPEGIILLRRSGYKLANNGNSFGCFLLRVRCPKEAKQKLLSWRNSFEKKHNTVIILRAPNVGKSLRTQLKLLRNTPGLITDPEPVRYAINTIQGGRPQLPLETPTEPQNYVNLTDFPFISIDPASDCPQTDRDLDDILHARKLSNGNYELMAGFADVAWYVKPGSKVDEHAARAGYSIYAGDTRLSLLGEELSCRKLSLLQDKERYAYIVKIIITPEGETPSDQIEFFRAKVNNHAALNYEEVEEKIKNHDPLIEDLMIASGKMRAHRLTNMSFSRGEDIVPGETIVEECMIQAKSKLAAVFTRAGVPIVYRTHALANDRFEAEIIPALISKGIIADHNSELSDPEQVRHIISALEKETDKHLLHKFIDILIHRASYSTENQGHYALGISDYMEIKGLRNYAGLLNQRQAAYLLDGETPHSIEELEKEAANLNRLRRKLDENVYRLLKFQQIASTLENKEPVQTRITEIRGRKYFLDIPGLYGDHLLTTRKKSLLNKLSAGDSVSVKIKGYNPAEDQYVFDLCTEETATT